MVLPGIARLLKKEQDRPTKKMYAISAALAACPHRDTPQRHRVAGEVIRELL